MLGVIRAVLGSLIFLGVLINFANVVGRYVFLKPIIWAEEILVFIMVWCVMLGAPRPLPFSGARVPLPSGPPLLHNWVRS